MLQMKNLSKLPLSFQENQGQAAPEVKFMARSSGYTLYLAATEAILLLRQPVASQGPRKDSKLRFFELEQQQRDPVPTRTAHLKLVGANEVPEVRGIEELPGKANYFIGSDPAGWRTDIPTYARVQYRNVYPGVDMVCYGNQGQLEWDFMVAPGADPSSITIDVEGSEQLLVNDQGDLVITIGEGQIRFPRPFAYQTANNHRREVIANYTLINDRQVCFRFGNYDTNRELVIDPILVYSTYLGGTSIDFGNDIAVDAAGNAYVTGATLSSLSSPPGFPTEDPIQADNNGNFDVFVTKINTNGNTLVYSTYLGGSGLDEGRGIAVDTDGNAYVTGLTSSSGETSPPGFPTKDPTQADNNGNGDVFVTKINAYGNALVYSTYLGGFKTDQGIGIAVDTDGNAYVTGFTSSSSTSPPGFPTQNPIQPDNNGSDDVFVTKINAAGNSLVYSTFLGGTGDDFGNGIAVDAAGNAYVTGFTNSSGTTSPPGFPTTTNPIQPDNNGSADAFVLKIFSCDIICPTDMTVFKSPGLNGTIVNYPTPTLSGDCPGATVSCVPPPGAFFPLGTTTVTCTVTDAIENPVAQCTFNVTVIPQLIRCQPLVTSNIVCCRK